MPLTAMEHYLVLTDDLLRTRDFYLDVLGMAGGYRPPLEFPGHWLYVGSTPCIHIAEWDSYTRHAQVNGLSVSRRAPGTGPVDHIAFNATDHEAMVALLEGRGIAHERNAFPSIGLRQIFLHDPNGVKIELNFMASRDALNKSILDLSEDGR